MQSVILILLVYTYFKCIIIRPLVYSFSFFFLVEIRIQILTNKHVQKKEYKEKLVVF
jgi:hypothetical protein